MTELTQCLSVEPLESAPAGAEITLADRGKRDSAQSHCYALLCAVEE